MCLWTLIRQPRTGSSAIYHARRAVIRARVAILMNVLWVHSVPLWPANDGNRIRHLGLLTRLGRRARIILVCPSEGVIVPEEVASACERVVTVQSSRRSSGGVLRRLRDSARREPSCFVPQGIRDLERTVQALGVDRRFDVCFGSLYVAPAMFAANAGAFVVDDQNVEAAVYEQLWRHESISFRKLARLWDWVLVREFERRWLRRADRVTVCSADDAEALYRAIPDRARPEVLPNGVDVPKTQVETQVRDEKPSVLFVGGFRYRPNEDAAVFLAEEIMPIVWEVRPNCELWIVGKEPTPRIRELAGPNVVVTGEVPTVTPYYSRARVVCAPVRMGGGTRLKVLEAMASMIPVVGTTTGLQGLGIRNGLHAVVADTAPELAEGIIRCLQDREFAGALARSGRALVESEYGWDAIAHKLEVLLLGLPDDESSLV